jgi:hypothetical protein
MSGDHAQHRINRHRNGHHGQQATAVRGQDCGQRSTRRILAARDPASSPLGQPWGAASPGAPPAVPTSNWTAGWLANRALEPGHPASENCLTSPTLSAVMGNLSVQWDLTDPLTLSELCDFVATAAALGVHANSELDLVGDPGGNERGTYGIAANGPGGGDATATVQVPRRVLGDMVETPVWER